LRNLFNASPARAAAAPPFKPHAFLEIAADNTITVWVGQTNLGQGTHTGIPMIIADELDAAWENVQVKMALAAEPFKDPRMACAGYRRQHQHPPPLGLAAQRWGRQPGRCWLKRPPSSGGLPGDLNV
jgi:CO/xanthine dehydrogenase Mo-binding subunit